MSRSGTLTYQIGNEIAQRGFGNSTIVGIGGDPIVGSSFIDIIALFEQDDETELIVMCGEIGGDEEERTAEYIAENVTKPVIAYIAGFTAPPGKTMGHAGAIVSGSKGTAAGEGRGARGQGRAGRPQPDRGGGARGRDAQRLTRVTGTPQDPLAGVVRVAVGRLERDVDELVVVRVGRKLRLRASVRALAGARSAWRRSVSCRARRRSRRRVDRSRRG